MRVPNHTANIMAFMEIFLGVPYISNAPAKNFSGNENRTVLSTSTDSLRKLLHKQR